MKKQIVNIINFVRGIEPREYMDLAEPINEQIKIMKKHDLKGTFLLQYDSYCYQDDTEYIDIMKQLDAKQFEIGIWFEVVQPLAEKAGIEWKGRFPWDWHAHCGFSVGYTENERERLVDIVFEDFNKVFGFYPKSFGAWAFDAHTIKYASEKYGIDASCNCKDQWGTDGYTLWGGYYNQGYYPSIHNSFCPAQSEETQINVPIFRMLGSDPIYQYDTSLDENRTDDIRPQGVITLEPVYENIGGGSGDWVDWYFSENFSGNCITFGYTQAGQENSFGWKRMKDGYTYQMDKIAKLVRRGKLINETLGETGRWYKETFRETPPSSVAAMSDWNIKNDSRDRRSIWYNCKNYRINIYCENKKFWIRDMYIFKDDYKERYLGNICTSNNLVYDNLPFIDGNLFSGNGARGGLYPVSENMDIRSMTYESISYKEKDNKAIIIFKGTICGDIKIILDEDGVEIIKTEDKILKFISVYDDKAKGLPQRTKISDTKLQLQYREYVYYIRALKGRFEDENTIVLNNNKIYIKVK